MLSSQLVNTTVHQTERFQGKNLQVVVPLSRLWKGLEDVCNRQTDEVVEISVDNFVTLVEQDFCSYAKSPFQYPIIEYLTF